VLCADLAPLNSGCCEACDSTILKGPRKASHPQTRLAGVRLHSSQSRPLQAAAARGFSTSG
jgi:hypothetical protein